MNKCLLVSMICSLALGSVVPRLPAQTTEEKRAAFEAEKQTRALDRKLKDNTGLPGDFHNFSKESDEELMQMLDTVKNDPNSLTGGRDNWRKFEQDLKTELDRRGRTPDGGWKKAYEDANANKVDINKKLNQQLREKQETNPIDKEQGAGAAENPNATKPVDAQKAPKNPAFENAETVVTERPPNSAYEKAETVVTERPPSEATSVPEESAAKEAGKAEGSATRTGQNASNTTAGEAQSAAAGEERAAGAGKAAPKTQAELAESGRQKLERGFNNNERIEVSREEMKAFEAEERAKREARAAVAGEERAAGAGKSALPEVPAGQTEGLWGTLKRWGGNLIEAAWGAAKVEATAQGSTRTIDHGEKKDTIQTALNTIDGEKKALEQHVKEVGKAYDLGAELDPKKGLSSPEGMAEIDRVKDKLGPQDAADLERSRARLKQLNDDQVAIEKGREALKDKWHSEGWTDIATSGGLGARTIDPNDLDNIPELKRYVPDLQKKESAPPPPGWDFVPQNPAEEKLLSALKDPDKRKKFADGRTNEEILNTFRATGSLTDVLKSKVERAADDSAKNAAAKTLEKAAKSLGRTADKSSPDLNDEDSSDEPPEPTAPETKRELTKSPLFGPSEESPPAESPDPPRLIESPLFGSAGESPPTDEAKDFVISDGAKPPPEAGSVNDFGMSDKDRKLAGNSTANAASGADAIGQAMNLDTSGFARGQANEDAAASRPKVEGDYAEAGRLENELRKAEEKWKRAVAEARRVAAQKRAAHELAIQQQQIAETQRRQYEAYQEMCVRQRAYDNWVAQQQTGRRAAKRQRRQQSVQQQQQGNAVHQDGGVIMDAPR